MALAPFVFGSTFFDDSITRAVDRSLGNIMGRGAFDMFPYIHGGEQVGRGSQGMLPWTSMAGSHPMDVVERDNTFEVHADAPGFSPEDIKVELNEGVLTISANKQEAKEATDEKGQVWRRERIERRFTRSFALPQTAAQENISANLENGVLTVTVPKLPAAPKPQPKRIAVGGSGGQSQQVTAGNVEKATDSATAV